MPSTINSRASSSVNGTLLGNHIVWRKITTVLSGEYLVLVQRETANLTVIWRLVSAQTYTPVITDTVPRCVASLHASHQIMPQSGEALHINDVGLNRCAV